LAARQSLEDAYILKPVDTRKPSEKIASGAANPILGAEIKVKRSIRILIVDDHPTNRKLLRAQLEAEAFTVVEAADGEAALVTISPDSLPDVITTDLVMPILNGERLIERLRSEPRTASIPIVVVSADPDAAWALQASGLVEGVVIKPFHPSALAACILSVAAAQGPAASSEQHG